MAKNAVTKANTIRSNLTDYAKKSCCCYRYYYNKKRLC